MSFILSLLFGRVMSISCDWLHFCFFARVLKCIVVKNHSYSIANCLCCHLQSCMGMNRQE